MSAKNRTAPVPRPATSARRGAGDPFDAGAIVADLRRVFGTDRTRPLSWRRSQLEALARLLIENEAEIAAAAEADLGRHAMSTFMADIAPITSEIRHNLKELGSWAGRRKVSVPITQRPGSAYVQPQPKGVVLIIGAWNFPVLLALHPLVSALAAGNVAAIKPSELSPVSAGLLARLLPEYLDPTAVQVVTGDAEASAALLEQRWDHIFFTGSTRVGQIVAQAAAKHLTPVTLELGGKSPVIVAAEANLDVAARRIAWAKFVNGGQACIAPDYVLVEDSVRPALVERLLVELPKAGEAAPSRIVNETHFDRLAGLLASHGGHTSGGVLRRDQLRISPALVTDPDPSSPLMSEEIFGPVLPVLSVDSVREAINFVNERPRPLALYVFTEDRGVADQVIDRTTSGSVGVNHLMYQLLVPELPFGGVGSSGVGAYHGQFGFDTFSHLKAVLRKPTSIDPSFAYPPYGRATERLLRRTMS